MQLTCWIRKLCSSGAPTCTSTLLTSGCLGTTHLVLTHLLVGFWRQKNPGGPYVCTVCVCMCVHTTCVCVEYVFVYVHTCICACTYVCAHMCMCHLCVCVCVCVCVCACMYVFQEKRKGIWGCACWGRASENAVCILVSEAVSLFCSPLEDGISSNTNRVWVRVTYSNLQPQSISPLTMKIADHQRCNSQTWAVIKEAHTAELPVILQRSRTPPLSTLPVPSQLDRHWRKKSHKSASEAHSTNK